MHRSRRTRLLHHLDARAVAIVTAATVLASLPLASSFSTVVADTPAGDDGSSTIEPAAARSKATIYVTDFGNDTVLVLEAKFRGQRVKGEFVEEIAGLDGPWGVAADPEGAFVYVANSKGDSVARISRRTHEVENVIRVGRDPRGIAITPDGTLALVANHGSKSVSVIDTSTDTVVQTVKVKKKPFNVEIDATGWVTAVNNLGSDVISLLEIRQPAAASRSADPSASAPGIGDVVHIKKDVCDLTEGLAVDYDPAEETVGVYWTCAPETASAAAGNAAAAVGLSEDVADDLRLQTITELRRPFPQENFFDAARRAKRGAETVEIKRSVHGFDGAPVPIDLSFSARTFVTGLGWVTPDWTWHLTGPDGNGSSAGIWSGGGSWDWLSHARPLHSLVVVEGNRIGIRPSPQFRSEPRWSWVEDDDLSPVTPIDGILVY